MQAQRSLRQMSHLGSRLKGDIFSLVPSFRRLCGAVWFRRFRLAQPTVIIVAAFQAVFAFPPDRARFPQKSAVGA